MDGDADRHHRPDDIPAPSRPTSSARFTLSRDIDALVAELLPLEDAERAAVVERWVAPRIGDVHPWDARKT